jgi:hypothetical protein
MSRVGSDFFQVCMIFFNLCASEESEPVISDG